MSGSTLSQRLKSPVIRNYGMAILLVAAAAVVDFVLQWLWEIEPTVSLFLCAIVFVAWAEGPGPALLATALAVFSFYYFFLPPFHSLAPKYAEIPRLTLFTLAALFVLSLSAAQRRTAASLRLARDEQQRTVQELQELNKKLSIENAERRQAEERRTRAEQELQLTVDTIPVLVARYRPDGFMDFRNKTWRSYTGLSQDNLEGHRWGGALHPDDLLIVEREWRAHIATGEPFELEQRLRRADGEYRWHWVRRVPLRDEGGEVVKWYGVAFDIDDRKQAENALRQGEAELAKARQESQLIIDTVPVLILRHRADGVIDFINQTGRNYSGLVTTNWTRRTSVITHPDDVPRIEEAWDVALAKGEPFETEQRLRRADGEYRWFATRRAPLRNNDGEVIAWYGATYDIEDRKRAEDALRRSEADLARARQDLQLTIDTISTMVVVFDQGGKAYFANRPAQEYFGKDFSVENVRDLIHPDDRDRVDRLWRTHLETGEPLQTEQRMLRADGEYRWNYVTRVPLRDETGKVIKWYGSGYDIEDRKRAETALREREGQLAEAQRELQLTIDSIPVMVSTFEPDGTRSYINKTWQNYTGHTPLEATGKGLDTTVYYHPDDVRRFENAWRASQAKGEMLSVDVRTRRADGAYRWYTMRRAPRHDANGNIVKWYSVGVDVEDQKIAEDAARKSQEALHAAQTALAHASRVATLGEISASIAHEVNQPLAAIVANGQACLRFLRSEAPNLDDVRGSVEWIVKDGNRAGEVIRRVRGLLKKSNTEKTPLDVKGLIEEVAALLQHELSAQLVTLQLGLAPATPAVFADRIQLQQVIINLVMNGVDAMHAITDRPRLLVIRSYKDDAGLAVIAVKDSGVGIPQESVDRLFDAFFSTKPGGLGIGLSICRSIIKDHGGQLRASDNDDGPGATFELTLPTYRERARPQPGRAKPDQNWIRE
jgi:PAS domain S-box-containing protein